MKTISFIQVFLLRVVLSTLFTQPHTDYFQMSMKYDLLTKPKMYQILIDPPHLCPMLQSTPATDIVGTMSMFNYSLIVLYLNTMDRGSTVMMSNSVKYAARVGNMTLTSNIEPCNLIQVHICTHMSKLFIFNYSNILLLVVK